MCQEIFHFKYYLCCQNFQFKFILVQAAAAAMDPGGLNGGAGLGGGIPESTRYPWMSITGRSMYMYMYICICTRVDLSLYSDRVEKIGSCSGSRR